MKSLCGLALLLHAWVLPLNAAVFPEIIPLPNGFQPEGIAVGHGNDFYVGSIPTGAIYKGDLRTGNGTELVAGGAGRAAIGLSFDSRSGVLFVAGGGTGDGYAYDSQSGELLQHWELAEGPGATFVNDVVVTRDAAWFTESQRPVLYRVPLGPGGRIPSDATLFDTVELEEPFEFVPGAFNSNGIDATSNGKALIIVNSTTGLLYRVDASTGEVTEIDLGGDLVNNGDGILLHGHILYVVQNRLNQIAVIELNSDLTEGTIVDTLTHPAFNVPTTIAERRHSLYAVNAKFGTPPTPDTPYEVIRVDL